MIEGEFQIVADALIDFTMNGRERVRAGNDHPWMAPHDTFPCAGDDAWVAIAVETDSQFEALCQVMGRPELAADDRFRSQSRRHEHRRMLDAPIAAWTRQRSHYQAQAALQAAGVPAGAVLNALELLTDPHVRARRGFEYVEVDGIGPTPYPRPAFTLDRTAVLVQRPPSRFGDANRYVLRDILGLDEARVAELYAAGIVADEPIAAGGH
jgi:crotonobetainyl-CoA:carnitine CoA-transferase CaiB-like acyl-CoA transferase